MTEEINTTSATDSDPVESSVGSFGQDEEQGIQTVEEIETEAVEAIVPDEKTVAESAIDAKPANMSDDGKVKEDVGGKTAGSVEPDAGEVAEEDESQVKEKEEIDAKKADEEDLPVEDKRKMTPANETQSKMRLNEVGTEDKEKNGKEEIQEVIEENAEGNEQKREQEKEEAYLGGKEEGELSEGEPANQSESENKGTAGNDGEDENLEARTEEDLSSDEEEIVVGVEPISASSEELGEEHEQGIADEEWISWKSEFVNKFNKRFDRKWIISGIVMVMLIVGFMIFFKVSGLRSSDSGEVTSLKEIAGPVYDMKFFLPLTVDSEKESFVKVTLAIELTDKGFRKEIDKKISDLREEVIRLILTKSPEEFRSSHAKEMLKKTITDSLNKHFSMHCIKNTYFTELVVL